MKLDCKLQGSGLRIEHKSVLPIWARSRWYSFGKLFISQRAHHLNATALTSAKKDHPEEDVQGLGIKR